MRSKLIFLTLENPFPPAGGAHIRDAQMIQLLSETMDIEVLCHAPLSDAGKPAESAIRVGDQATPPGVTVTRVSRKSPGIFKRAVSTMRPEVLGDYSHAIEQALQERAVPGRLLWISRLGMGKYLKFAKDLGYRTILDQHQVETHVLWKNATQAVSHFSTAAQGMGDFAIAAQCSVFESKVCRLADAVVAASELDASRLMRMTPGLTVHVIPHAIDCAKHAPLRASQGKNILFTGALNYLPNLQGIQWFLRDVMPRLRGALQDRVPHLVVAGSNPSSELYSALDAVGGELHADPVSLNPYLADAAVVIIPIRSGRSMRFKILEAMASGRAVVTTPRGVEGLLLAPAYDIFVAETADKFAGAISRLIENPNLLNETALRAAQTADARFDWRCTRSLLEALLTQIHQ